MENDNESNNSETEVFKRMKKNHRNGRILKGLILVSIGSLFFAREMGVFFPAWLFSWPVLLIVIGLYVGIKHQFQKPSWLVWILLGSAILLRNFFPMYDLSHYILPIILIIVGIYVIIKPNGSYCRNNMKWQQFKYQQYQRPE
jgi:predicted membrane protein